MKLTTSVAWLTALTLTTTVPAFAGQHQRRDQNRSSEGTKSQDNGQNNRTQDRAVERRADAPRAEAPRAAAPQARTDAPRAAAPPTRIDPPRAAEQPRAEAPRADANRRQGDNGQRQNGARQNDNRQNGNRQYDNRQNENRQNENRQNGNRQSDNRQYDRSDYGRRDGGQAVPRVAPRVDNYNRYRGNRPVIIAPRYYGSRGYYSAPYRGYRPYSFRPRTRLNFGIYLGYPEPYVYSYAYPVPVYGYGRPSAPIMIGPNSPYYGGVSLEISPSDGEVFVDGTYAGYVEDFDGTQQPLTLTAGSHRIEIRAPGYETLVLDVNVNPGEIVPYRGDMQAYRY
jgi:hypothetical protein